MAGRKSTRFQGVQARESSERRWRGRPDVCFTIDYRAGGKRVRKDVGWASQGMSAQLAAEIRAQEIARARGAETAPESILPELTLGEAWEKYLNEWLMPKGKMEVKASASQIRYLDALLPKRLSQITPYDLDSVMTAMRQRGLSDQTIRHAIGLARRIMRRMVKWRLYSGNLPFDDISMPRPNNARERYLTPEEARALLDELQRRSRQTWAMALVSLHCGLRFGEIARLRWQDVNLAEMSLFIPESKNGRARHAVLTDEVVAALQTMPQGARTDLIFPARGGGVMQSVSCAFFRAVDALGLNRSDGQEIRDARRRVVFHSLRHTYASWLALGGQGQMIIADRLGHRSLAMTQRYVHLMDESRRETAECISRAFHGTAPQGSRPS